MKVNFHLTGFLALLSISVSSCNKDNVINNTANTSPQPSEVCCEKGPPINARLVPIGTLSRARGCLVSAAAGNKILFAGGYALAVPPEPNAISVYTTRVDIYDIESNSWSIAELSAGGNTEYGIAAASSGTRVFFAGGHDKDGKISSIIDIYDATTNQWSTIEFSRGITLITAAVAIGTKILFADVNAIHIYDDSNNTWAVYSLQRSRTYLSATATATKAYFAGGYYDDGPDVNHTSNIIDVYDNTTNSWSIATMTQGRASLASIAVTDKIFWVGGFTDTPEPQKLSIDMEIKNLNTGTSSLVPIQPRYQFNAVKTNENIVFFTGFDLGYNPLASTHFEIYNIKSDTLYTGILDKAIVGAAVIAVNNTIYVAGGGSYSTFPPYNDTVWKLEF